jgi:hypothetical protein
MLIENRERGSSEQIIMNLLLRTAVFEDQYDGSFRNRRRRGLLLGRGRLRTIRPRIIGTGRRGFVLIRRRRFVRPVILIRL